jgi:hypothetical protein
MAGGMQEDRERRPQGAEHRLRELEPHGVAATRSLISAATIERRTRRREELEREVQRLHQERRRLEREHNLTDHPTAPGHEVDRHLSEIERQLRQVIGERRRLTSDWPEDRSGHQNGLSELARLKSETDRLTAELLRCAYSLSREPKKNPRLRRIWHMLRLSGS